MFRTIVHCVVVPGQIKKLDFCTVVPFEFSSVKIFPIENKSIPKKGVKRFDHFVFILYDNFSFTFRAPSSFFFLQFNSSVGFDKFWKLQTITSRAEHLCAVHLFHFFLLFNVYMYIYTVFFFFFLLHSYSRCHTITF